MALVTDPGIRKSVRLAIRRIRREWPHEWKPAVWRVGMVHEWDGILSAQGPKNRRAVRERFGPDASLTYLTIIAAATLSLAIQDEDTKPIPKSWLEPESTADANFVVGQIVKNITNLAQASMHSIEQGLLVPAGVLIRSLDEASWLVRVVASDKKKMLAYLESLEPDADTQDIWRRHFSPTRLRRDITQLEDKLGTFDQAPKFEGKPLSEGLQSSRAERYSALSEFAHPSLAAIQYSALLEPLEQTVTPWHRVFGMASAESDVLLHHMCMEIFEVVHGLLTIFKSIHHSRFLGSVPSAVAYALYRCMGEAGLQTLVKDNPPPSIRDYLSELGIEFQSGS